jgi:hypothetical protein
VHGVVVVAVERVGLVAGLLQFASLGGMLALTGQETCGWGSGILAGVSVVGDILGNGVT